MAKDLRTFLDTVKPLGSDFYIEARKPIDPELEVGALQYKLSREGHSPVIYCPKVNGSELPIITNVLGGEELLGLALGIPREELRPGNRDVIVREFSRRLSELRDPVEVPAERAPVREKALIGADADLTRLPITRQAPLNSGKYVTAGMTILVDPDTGIPNVGVYRQELKGARRLAIAPGPGQHGYAIARRYAELGKPMEVATVIGHHPACLIGAAVAQPDKRNGNELRLMGALLEEPLEITRGLTVNLPVPAGAEIVIEGVVDPSSMEKEGPFSEGAGFYSDGRDCWVIDVTAITMRHDAIYEDLQPTQAEHWLSFVLQSEHNVLETIKAQIPGVRSVHRGPDGMCARKLIYISVRKRNDDDGLRAGAIALRRLQSGTVIVVDDDIDAHDEGDVLWAVATGLRRVAAVDRTTGELIAPANPIDLGRPTDPTAPRSNALLVLDATRPLGAPALERASFPADLLRRLDVGAYFRLP